MHSLDEALDVVNRFCRKTNLEESHCFKLRLVSEELVVNLLKHAKAESFSLALEKREEETYLLLSYAGERFDPSASDLGPLDSVEESTPGGLGLFLVKSVAKCLNYRYESGVNFVEIVI